MTFLQTISHEKLFEHSGRIVTQTFAGKYDARKRRTGQIAQQVVVIHTDDGHVLGNPHTNLSAIFRDLKSLNIVAGQDPKWCR